MVHLSNVLTLSLITSASSTEPSAHVIIDMQECFMEACGTATKAGSLAVTDSNSIINNIRAFRDWGKNTTFISHTIWSKDAHPQNHISFASNHVNRTDPEGKPMAPFIGSIDLVCNLGAFGEGESAAPQCCRREEGEKANDAVCGCELDGKDGSPKNPKQCRAVTQALWPDHCVPGKDNDITSLLTPDEENDTIVLKGTEEKVDSYSAFFANLELTAGEIETAKAKEEELTAASIMLPTLKTLNEKGIKNLYFSGLATDYCVKFSALHAAALGFKVTLLSDTVKGVWVDGQPSEEEVLQELKTAGVTVMTTAEVVQASGLEQTLEDFEREWKLEECNHGAILSMYHALAFVTMLVV